MSGVGSLVEAEDSDRVLAQVALVSGVTIGPQVTIRSLCCCSCHRTCVYVILEEPVLIDRSQGIRFLTIWASDIQAANYS